MPKRSFPFNNYTPLQLKTHVESKHVNNNGSHMKEIYAKTQNLLKAGAKASPQKNQNCLLIVCQLCKKLGDTTLFTKCSFCDKAICGYCCNTCFNCEHNFCALCSVISYDSPEERSYCLSCCR